MPTEVDKFFEDLPSQDRGNVDELLGDTPKAPEKEEVEEEEEPKNRTQRRMADKIQRERELNIAMNQRIIDLAEEVKTLRGQKQPVQEDNRLDPDLSRAFGTTPEGLELTRIFQSKLEGLEASAIEKAKAQVIAEWEETQSRSQEEYQEELGQNENYIDTQLESLEENYNVDLTSNSPSAVKARKEFLGLVEKLSPKDSGGAIVEYADFDTTFEIFKGMQSKPEPSRAKEIASRSMQNSTGSGQEVPQGPMTFAKAKQYISRLSGN